MKVGSFLDTNLLIYAAMKTGLEPTKSPIALRLLAEGDFGLSAQVLQEFYVTSTQKAHVGLKADEALAWIDRLTEYPCVPLDQDLVRIAIALSERHKINYWDAAILAAAERLGAETLYTEDLSHGQAYGSVTAINPFLGA